MIGRLQIMVTTELRYLLPYVLPSMGRSIRRVSIGMEASIRFRRSGRSAISAGMHTLHRTGSSWSSTNAARSICSISDRDGSYIHRIHLIRKKSFTSLQIADGIQAGDPGREDIGGKNDVHDKDDRKSGHTESI